MSGCYLTLKLQALSEALDYPSAIPLEMFGSLERSCSPSSRPTPWGLSVEGGCDPATLQKKEPSPADQTQGPLSGDRSPKASLAL